MAPAVGDRVELINMGDRSIWQDRCLSGRRCGTVKFVGALYVGVELDVKMSNAGAWRRFGQSTDGTLYGKRYFQTSVGCGIFIPSQNVRRIEKRIKTTGRMTRSGKVFARPERIVDINSCTVNELLTLPGIGPILAGRIVRNRPFRSLEDMSYIERLSRGVIESLKSRVRFGRVAVSTMQTLQRSREDLQEKRERVSSYEKKLRDIQVRMAREKIDRDRQVQQRLVYEKKRKQEEEKQRVADLRKLAREKELQQQQRLLHEKKRKQEEEKRHVAELRKNAREKELQHRLAYEKKQGEKRRKKEEKRRREKAARDRLLASTTTTTSKKKTTNSPVIMRQKDDPPPPPLLEDKLKKMLRISKPYNVRHVATGESGRYSLSPSKPSQQQKETSYISFAIVLALKAELVQEPRPLVLPTVQTDTPTSSDNGFTEIVKHTPHYRGNLSFQQFQFFDYAPCVFRSLRELFDVKHESYLESMSQPLQGGGQGDGKSGMCFFFSYDRKYVLKTVKAAEIPVLLGFLSDYHQYFALQRTSLGKRPIRQQQCSLLPRFFGLHKVCFPDRSAFYLIVMRNILYTNSSNESTTPIHRVFDLKGSMAGRFVDTKSGPRPQQLRNGLNVDKRTLKDLNFTAEILLSSSEERELLIQQLRSDVHFLTRHNIMDYSLLLGIMFLHNPPWRISRDSLDLMPHKAASSTSNHDNRGDKAYLHASMLRAYTSRKAMATLLPEGSNLTVRASISSYAQVPEKNYIVYAIQLTVYDRDNKNHLRDTWTVFRRYSEFDRLASSLNQDFFRKTGAQIPKLPPKRIFGSMNEKFLKQRMRGLELWTQQILAVFGGDKITYFEKLREFLTRGANCPPGGAVAVVMKRRKISDHVVDRLSGAGCGKGIKALLAPAGDRGRSNKTCQCVVFFGIIDVLQSYNAKKQIESIYKSVAHNGTAISAVETAAYGKRFMDYMMEVFPSVRD